MTLVIMAAGMGSRFGGSKQTEPIDEYGNFIIDYSIYDAIQEGFTKVVFIIKEENYEFFKETIGARVEKHIKVEYAFQDLNKLPVGYTVPEGRVKPWGTGHAILCAKDYVDENFAIINADDFYGRDAYHTIAEFLKNNHDETKYAMVGYVIANTLTENGSVKRGLCKEENGYLAGLTESRIEDKNGKLIAEPIDGGASFEVPRDGLVSMSLFGLTPKLFTRLEKEFLNFLDNMSDPLTSEFLMPTFIFEQVERGEATVKVLKTDAVWQGVTYREDKEKVVKALKALVDAGEYPEGVWK